MRRAALPLLMMLAQPALADGGRVDEILAEAEAECARIDAGGIQIQDGAVTSADLDGDGLSDDAVVDFSNIFCDYNMSHWHGSGGAPLHFVIDDARSQSWWGFNWIAVDFEDMRVILLARHGSVCDNYGASPCVQALVPTVDGFQVVRMPESEEEAG
ncbi:hypothetical protein [Roseisalinus antarcticus]|uniref:Uncharacterized protein n=1 Tax=Roseisalinus antarcticus TaxID=254357 RepID=A0A1Y5RQ23_9RHOB|nr:hypothetical protein [Roseisalinus antarcticus]SLN21632.1 hypothetical protein ROA7023_00576 [Roseisalinus antarcticus]